MSSLETLLPARGQADARKLGSLCFLDAIERRGDASLGSDDIGPALEQLRGHSDRRRRRHRRQLLGDTNLRRGIPPEQRLERPQRLVARIIDLPQRVTVRPQVGARFGNRLLVAHADAKAFLGETQQLAGRAHHLRGDRSLQRGLDGQKIRLRHERSERLARIRIVRIGRCELRLRRGLTVAHTAPHVELERRVEPNALQSRAVAPGLAAAVGKKIHRRARATRPRLSRSPRPARRARRRTSGRRYGRAPRRRAPVSTRIVERVEPLIDDRLRRAALPLPLGGNRRVGERLALNVGRRRRPLDGAACNGPRSADRKRPATHDPGDRHQCSFRIR